MDLLETDDFGGIMMPMMIMPTPFDEEILSNSSNTSEEDEGAPATPPPSLTLAGSSEEFVPDSVAEDTSSASPTLSRRKKSQHKDTSSSKKRSRKQVEPMENVKLDRSVLLSITSTELEEMVEATRNARKLTKSEEKEVKRQLRLVKNRESAAASRNRKRRALDTLQEKNDKLQAELEAVKRQNAQLQERESQMKSWLVKCGQFRTFVEQYSLGPQKSNNLKPGVSLFIVLLSFGFLFNAALVGSSNTLPVLPQSWDEPSHAMPGANMRQLMQLEDDVLLPTECITLRENITLPQIPSFAHVQQVRVFS